MSVQKQVTTMWMTSTGINNPPVRVIGKQILPLVVDLHYM